MEKNDRSIINERRMVAFFFDSGRIHESFYGEVVFNNFIEGMEIIENSYKIIFSIGDIFDNNIYDDITPFIVRDDICTIKKNKNRYIGTLFVFLLEDIETKIAISIDERLKNVFSAYLGMTSIDIKSTDRRKQFWKSLVRRFNIEGETITCFGSEEEESFGYGLTAKNKGLRVNYDGFPCEYYCEGRDDLFSTRQSSFIKSISALEYLDGQSDSDRGISEMNFSLVKEVGIAGVQVWKSIEDINQVYIPKTGNGYNNIDFIFTSLYQAAQGIERLLKITLELIMYENEDETEKQKIDKLLFSHNHPAMYDFISKKENISLKTNCKRLLNVLSSFYSNARYNRFRHNDNNVLELKILQDFGHDIKESCFDKQIKHIYGKSLGATAQSLYKLIENLSDKLNIYVYELSPTSTANLSLHSYYGEDLYETLKQTELAKKEFLWYLMKDGNKLAAIKMAEDLLPLSFEKCDVAEYAASLIKNKDSCNMLHDFVSASYDDLVEQDKAKWKERIEIIDALVGNPKVVLDEYFGDGEV